MSLWFSFFPNQTIHRCWVFFIFFGINHITRQNKKSHGRYVEVIRSSTMKMWRQNNLRKLCLKSQTHINDENNTKNEENKGFCLWSIAPGIMKNAEREMLPGSCAMHMLFIDKTFVNFLPHTLHMLSADFCL